MQLVERHILDKSDPRWKVIDEAAWFSKNLYNAANYLVRQSYIAGQGYLNYNAIEKRFKQKDLLADQQLPMKVVQQVLQQLDHDWQAYFAALEAWKAQPEKFQGKPRLPKYKDKEQGRNLLVYTAQAISNVALRRGFVKPSGLAIRIKTAQREVDQVRIVPRNRHYVVEVIYSIETQAAQVNPDHVLAVDLGVDNLAALASNQPGFVPLLVNGKPLKSINQGYNKALARLKSALPAGQRTSQRIQRLTHKRNCRMDAYLHLASRRIIDAMIDTGIGTLVIGKNDGWKQNVHLGSRTNQHFVQIPHARFIEMLTYKAQWVGIAVITREESYTSKCSFLDLEPIGKQGQYAGKRIKRGVFRASNGRQINADVNGAYNILRKVIPNAFGNGIGGAVVHPLRLRL
ncbi:MAG: RNA-guided endonuclease InsQ/TnpB family protein [Phototrophicaceae bacterium]